MRDRESGSGKISPKNRQKGETRSALTRAYLHRKRAIIAIAAAAILGGQAAQASNGTWSGGSLTDGNWSDSSNWLGGVVPGSTTTFGTDTATFSTAIANGWGTSTKPIVIDQPNQNIQKIIFDGAAGPYFIGSTTGNALLLTSGGALTLGTTASSFSGTNTIETINAPLVLEPLTPTSAGAYSFINNSTTASNVFNIGGGISGGTTSSGVTLTLGGANTGPNTISGIIADGGAAGGVSLSVTGGTWVLNNANTYSGTTTITAGALNIQNANALGTGTSAVAVNGTTADLQLQGNITVAGRALTLALNTTSATLENISGNNTWSGNITVSNASITRIFSDAGTLTLSGNITNGGTGSQFVLQNNGAGVISGTLSGSGGLTHSATGTGIWIISGPSNYTGPTAISNGALDFQNGTPLTTTSGVTVSNGAALQLQGTITTGTAPVALLGTGNLVAGATGAFENISGANSYAGLITLNGNTTISSDAGTLALTNPGTITGAADTITLAGAGSGSIASIIGTTTGGITKNGAGTWTLSGANTYTGATTVSAGTLTAGVASVAGVNGAFGNNSAVTIANVAGATLNLAGFNTQINSLIGVGTTGGVVTLGGGTLTISTTSGSNGAFGGVISGTGNLVITGAGTQTLSGTNTFGSATNSVTINSGATLNINSAAALGNIANTLIINGGTIDNTTAANITIGAYPQIWNGNFAFGGTAHSITATGNVTLTNNVTYSDSGAAGGQLIVNGNISGNFALSKAGTQGLTLGGNNTFTALNVLAGTVSGTSATAFGSGTINLGNSSGSQNTTLSSGFAGTIANPISVTAGNTGVATLTNSVATTFSGPVVLANNLTISPAAFALNVTGGITGTGNLNLNSTAVAGVITVSSGTVNNTGTITNSGTAAATNVISAVIGTNVTGVIQNSATSVLSLTAANTFTSGVTIDSGTLSGSNASAFGSGTITLASSSASANAILSSAFAGTIANPISVASGGIGTNTITSTVATTFSGPVTLNSQNLTVSPAASAITLTGGVTGAGNVILNATAAGAANLTSVNNTGTITNSGAGTATSVISGVIGSNVTGVIQNSPTSSLLLSGVNTNYAGPVTLTSGTLIAGSTSSTGTGTVTLNGGTLASTASATVAGNVLAGSAAHVIAPGGAGSTGTLTIGGNLTTSANTTLAFDEYSPTNGDLLVVNGTINASAAPTVTFTTAPETAGTYQLISNSNAAALASQLTLPTAPTNGGHTYTYAWDTTNAGFLDVDVTVTGGSNISGVWQGPTGSSSLSWTLASNWTAAGIPGTAGDTANFNTAVTIAQTVQLNGQQHLAALTLNPSGAGGSYVFVQGTAGASLVFDNGAGAGTLTNSLGSNSITAPVTLASNTNATVAAATTLTISGPVSGPGNLTKLGTGTLTLSGANTFTGTTSITAGSLNLANGNALAGSSSITVSSNAALVLSGNITVPSSNASASIIGTGTASIGALNNLSGTNTWAANITLTTNGATNNLNGNTTRIGQSGGSLTISGVISGGSDLLFRNIGTMVISGANIYTGVTEIASGITQLGANNSLPTTTILNMGLTSVSGTFDLNGFNQTVAGFQITTGVDKPTTGLSNVVTNSSTTPSIFTFFTNSNASYGPVAGGGNAGSITGNLSIVKLGTATFTLGPAGAAGANSYTGATIIGNGTLALGATGALPATTTVGLGATSLTSGTGSATSGIFDLAGFSQTITGVSVVAGSGPSSQVINSVAATAGALNVAVPSGTTDTFSGSLGGTGANNFSLTQSGSGTLMFTNASTYSGTTTVSAGTLLAANGSTGSATGTGTVSVTSLGTLGSGPAGGTVAGATTVTGGTAQGNSTGTLAFANVLTLTSGANFQFILNAATQIPSAPMISVPTAGSLNIPASTAVNLVNGGAEAIGTYYLIGYGSNTDPYPALTLGTLPAGFNYALVDDTTNQSIDLAVTAVPEPVTGMPLAAAAFGLLARRRRRRDQTC